jgi:hypothetical protein
MASLRAALKRAPGKAGHAAAVYLTLVLARDGGSTKQLKLARKFTEGTTSAEAWLARLEVERAAADDDAVRAAWAEARARVQGAPEDVASVWTWRIGEKAAGVMEVGADFRTARSSRSARIYLRMLITHAGAAGCQHGAEGRARAAARALGGRPVRRRDRGE